MIALRIGDKGSFLWGKIGFRSARKTPFPPFPNDLHASLFVPRRYTVQHWDAATGDLKRTETVQERWKRIGEWDLQARHTATQATATGLCARSLTLTKHEQAGYTAPNVIGGPAYPGENWPKACFTNAGTT